MKIHFKNKDKSKSYIVSDLNDLLNYLNTETDFVDFGLLDKDKIILSGQRTNNVWTITYPHQVVLEETIRQETYTYPGCSTKNCSGKIKTLYQDSVRLCGKCVVDKRKV